MLPERWRKGFGADKHHCGSGQWLCNQHVDQLDSTLTVDLREMLKQLGFPENSLPPKDSHYCLKSFKLQRADEESVLEY